MSLESQPRVALCNADTGLVVRYYTRFVWHRDSALPASDRNRAFRTAPPAPLAPPAPAAAFRTAASVTTAATTVTASAAQPPASKYGSCMRGARLRDRWVGRVRFRSRLDTLDAGRLRPLRVLKRSAASAAGATVPGRWVAVCGVGGAVAVAVVVVLRSVRC